MNGRASSFFDCESDFDEGVYKLTVNVKDYYTSMNKITFFPYIDVSHNNLDTLTKNEEKRIYEGSNAIFKYYLETFFVRLCLMYQQIFLIATYQYLYHRLALHHIAVALS